MRTFVLPAALIALVVACRSDESPSSAPPAQSMNSYSLCIGTYTQDWACNEKKECTSGGIY